LCVGRGEHGRPPGNALLGQSVMHVKRCQQSKARMMVLGVVPGEEDVAMRPCVLDRAETLREIRSVLERLELRFRERVVVRDVGTAVGLRTRKTINVRSSAGGRDGWCSSSPRETDGA
jgi:hypothetical protein